MTAQCEMETDWSAIQFPFVLAGNRKQWFRQDCTACANKIMHKSRESRLLRSIQSYISIGSRTWPTQSAASRGVPSRNFSIKDLRVQEWLGKWCGGDICSIRDTMQLRDLSQNEHICTKSTYRNHLKLQNCNTHNQAFHAITWNTDISRY